MSRGRSVSVVLASAFAAAVAAFLLSTALAQGGGAKRGTLARRAATIGQPLARWWGPPADVRAMLSRQEHVGSTARSNTVALTWDANPESDVVGYEVVWRDSSDSNWTDVIPVGNVTGYTATTPNKDSTLFGVRAINRAGVLSPVAFPALVN